MKVLSLLAVSLSAAAAFNTRGPKGARRTSAVKMSDYDLDFGSNNGYVPADIGDGGQGQFGAQSPANWRVPGTSPVGEQSYAGAADGGDEPWFSEAVSTVSLDLAKAEDTIKAFTREAAMFKVEEFCTKNSLTDKDKVLAELTGAMGYDAFLASNAKQLQKAWDKMYPPPKKEGEAKAAKKAAKKAPKKKAAKK